MELQNGAQKYAADGVETYAMHGGARHEAGKAGEIRFLAVEHGALPSTLLVCLEGVTGMRGEACSDAKQVLRLLATNSYHVVLCNLNLPGIGGMALLEEVRETFPDIPFICISASSDAPQAVRAMKAGASDYLVKPLKAEELIASIHQAVEAKRLDRGLEKQRQGLEELVWHRTGQLESARSHAKTTGIEILQAFGYVLGLRDTGTAGHCHRVTRYTLELAKAMRCSRAELQRMARGAYLHDIGKVGIDDAILRKPGPLTPEERAVMETHVQIGYQIVRRISLLADCADIVLAHQERYDGKGYPQGLAAGEIPLGARIFAVADTLDAMTSDRSYRRAMPFPVAREEIMRQSGRQFDPDVVAAFLSLPDELWERIRNDVQFHRLDDDWA